VTEDDAGDVPTGVRARDELKNERLKHGRADRVDRSQSVDMEVK
jgi:hypothetical protein